MLSNFTTKDAGTAAYIVLQGHSSYSLVTDVQGEHSYIFYTQSIQESNDLRDKADAYKKALQTFSILESGTKDDKEKIKKEDEANERNRKIADAVRLLMKTLS